MKNFKNMLKQAQEMQAKMADLQEKMANLEVEGQAGGGMVKVTVNGRGEAKAIKIDPAIVSKDEIEMMEDLIVAAINDAKGRAEAKMQEEMSKITQGLPIGDMKLPF